MKDNTVVIVSAVLLALICSIFFTRQVKAEELTASWYSIDSLKMEGTWHNGIERRMANGQRFNDNGFTCASWDYPLGSSVLVRNIANGKEVTVTVTDRTARRFKGKRIDLSAEAFKVLAPLSQGLVKVSVERIG